MRRLQCAECDIGGFEGYRAKECIDGYKDRGKVTDVKNTTGKLLGLEGIFQIRVYTVTCQKCGRVWHYRKKRKETQNRKHK